MKANETPHEMSLQEKAICLALTGRKPELPYPPSSAPSGEFVPPIAACPAVSRLANS